MIKEFKPKDWVLGRNSNGHRWDLDIFTYYEDEHNQPYHCMGCTYSQCLLYEGNEELLGTKNEPKPKKWKPKEAERYYMPVLILGEFIPTEFQWDNEQAEIVFWKKGWIFKTKEECQCLCDKLSNVR